MDNNKLREYAKAVVKVGVNVQENQPAYISTHLDGIDFANMVAEEAYKAGASDVYIDYRDPRFALLRYKHAKDEAFTHMPKWISNIKYGAIDDGACFISIIGEDPEVLKTADPKKVATSVKTKNIAMEKFSTRLMSNERQWCVVFYPSKEIAQKIFPNVSTEEAIEKTMEKIFEVTRLSDNTAEDWKKHIQSLEDQSTFLNSHNFKELVFTSSNGTNLTVGLVKDHIWASGGDVAKNNAKFVANIPTEEVFTMPDRNNVHGVVKSSKPLIYNGNIIDDFSLTFKDGAVVEYSAKVGYETLKGLLETDEGSVRIGEVALVPYESPISLSNLTFYNTLFDENASCHLAFGRAYPFNMKNSSGLSKDELKEKGSNQSLIHEDFMIGTKDTNIVGIKENGEKVDVFKNGNWAF